MKKKPLTILLIVFLFLGAVSVGLISYGQISMGSAYNQYDGRRIQLQNHLSDIGAKYLTFGEGKETQSAISTFLNDLPQPTRDKVNVVIAEESGKLLLQLNGNYIQTNNAVEMAMAWNGFAMLVDPSGNRHWYWVTDTYLSHGVTPDDPVYMVGASKIAQTQNELSDMMNSFDWSNAEACVSIRQVGKDNSGTYLFWFRDKGTDDIIERSLGSYDANYYWGFACAGFVVLLLYWLLAPVWVFLDARRRQTQPLPWALLVLLTNLIGLIVYWIVQSQNEKAEAAHVCPACGKPVRKEHIYCPWCAEPLVKGCKGCGKALEREWVACPWCGKPVE